MDPTTEKPAEKAFDVAEVKSLLNLPETSSDIELIQALVELIAGLQAKYDAVLADAVALEDTVKNRDISDNSDIITEGTKAFWEHQLLTNRDNTLQALSEIRNSHQTAPVAVDPAAATPVPAKVAERIPLRNREPAAPRTSAEIISPESDESRAVKILNRANALIKDEGIGFTQAFRKAESEFVQ
jgi:hypothetical protein